MAADVRRVTYFYATTKDEPGASYRVLAGLAGAEVNLLAFHAIPTGPDRCQLTLFPDDPAALQRAADNLKLVLHGPQRAFIIQGDDRLGALADIHRRLFDAQVNVFSSSGVADGRGGYGYIVYVRPEDYESAAAILDV